MLTRKALDKLTFKELRYRYLMDEAVIHASEDRQSNNDVFSEWDTHFDGLVRHTPYHAIEHAIENAYDLQARRLSVVVSVYNAILKALDEQISLKHKSHICF